MKPLTLDVEDAATLQELGRQSVQIVHDIKNQLNGLKLYATFLRKRMERAERPEDERETIQKLIAGLERASTDAAALVRLARPLELRCQPQADLAKILASAFTQSDLSLEAEGDSFQGTFDVAALTEALRDLTQSARQNEAGAGASIVSLRKQKDGATQNAVIEWRGLKLLAQNDKGFNSLAMGSGLRASLAMKVIKAHGGEIKTDGDTLRIVLPLENNAEG